MTATITRETLDLTNEGVTAEVRETTQGADSWVELVSTDGDLLLTLNDNDCSNLIVALTNVWRARIATNLEALQETP